MTIPKAPSPAAMEPRKPHYLDHYLSPISSHPIFFFLALAASFSLIASTTFPANWFFSTATTLYNAVSSTDSNPDEIKKPQTLFGSDYSNYTKDSSGSGNSSCHHTNPEEIKKTQTVLGKNESDTVILSKELNISSGLNNGVSWSDRGMNSSSSNLYQKFVPVNYTKDSGESTTGSGNSSCPKSDRGSNPYQKFVPVNYSKGFEEGIEGVYVKKCDVYDGRWVRDLTKPHYRPGSCPYIDGDFDCFKNGRPDDEYLRWRWKPHGCDIPSLNATDFLERLRGKRILFVGDSLNRNMWESLVCILRNDINNKSRVYEVSGRSKFKMQGYYSLLFEDYMCSVDFVRSPFLVKEQFLKNENGSEDERLRLDLLDESTAAYHRADIVVFNTGHWWTHEKTSSGKYYYQEGNHVYPVLEVMKAYKKALITWAEWVDRNINPHKTQIVFRGYSLTHFRGGQWNSGGQCHKETEPIYNETFITKYPEKMIALEGILHKMETQVVYLNISRLTDYRKDGHPSIYRKKYNSTEEHIEAEKIQDCSHWCLPGVPDTWNELLYASLLMEGKGSWKQ